MTGIRRLFTKADPADMATAYAILGRAAADGVSIPRMTVVWNHPDGPEVSMTVCTPDEYTTWVEWLDAKPRTINISGPREVADATVEGVRFYLAVHDEKAAS